MDHQTIVFIVMIAIGVIIFGSLIDYAAYYTDSAKNSISNESVTFAANNTCVALKNGPVSTISACYDDAAHTNTFGSDRSAVCDATRIKVYTNGTTAWPNMTTGTIYCDYTKYKPTGLGATIVGLMVAVLALAVILIWLGFV